MAQQHIPPIQCLLTFEALARRRHAGRAADGLCVTPSAVSHRTRRLESRVGLKLFGRADFSLTADGVATLANVRAGLAAFQQMPARRGARGGTRLRVAITPTFCRPFVMPRLELFRRRVHGFHACLAGADAVAAQVPAGRLVAGSAAHGVPRARVIANP